MGSRKRLPADRICNYGARIKHKRRQLGLTQETLASRVGLDRKTISRYERNACDFKRATLHAIFDALGLKICDDCIGCKDDLDQC